MDDLTRSWGNLSFEKESSGLVLQKYQRSNEFFPSGKVINNTSAKYGCCETIGEVTRSIGANTEDGGSFI